MDLVQLKKRDDTAEAMNWAAILSETQGRRLDILPPPDFDAPPADLAERAFRALYDVSDPEFPISLVDLGLVYGVEVDESEPGAARVTVAITLTATACPCVEFIKWDVRERVLAEPGVASVDVHITWDPPWTTARITERGRAALQRAGVSI